MAHDEEFEGYKEQLQAFTEGKELLYNFNVNNNNDEDPRQQGRDAADEDVKDLAETFRMTKSLVAEELLSTIQTLQYMSGLRGVTYSGLRERALQSVRADLRTEFMNNARPSLNLPPNNVPRHPSPNTNALQSVPAPAPAPVAAGTKRRINDSLNPLKSQQIAAESHRTTLQKWQTMFTWFKHLMEELEPVHDCPPKRVDYLCKIVDAMPSTINWEPLGIISDGLKLPPPPEGRTLQDLEKRILEIANAISKKKGVNSVTELEVAIPMCIGQFIATMMPNEFQRNIFFITPEKIKPQRTYKALPNELLQKLLESLRPTFIYRESGGVFNYGTIWGVQERVQATTFVDPFRIQYLGDEPLHYTHEADDTNISEMDEVLGNISVDVTRQTTQVVFENFSKYPIRKFPSTKMAAILAELIKIYAKWKKAHVEYKGTGTPTRYLSQETEKPTPRGLRGQITHKPETLRVRPSDTRESVIRGLKLKVVELYRYIDDPEPELNSSNISASHNHNSLVSEPANILEVLAQNVRRPLPIETGILPPMSQTRANRRVSPPPAAAPAPPSVALSAQGRHYVFGPTLPAQDATKLKQNQENMIELVNLAIAIYDELYSMDPDTALMKTMYILLHLKSYGDEIQLRELDAFMQTKPADTLLLESNDRILLGLAGMYAVRNGWNLITLAGNGVVRDYRTKEAIEAAKARVLDRPDLEEAKAATTMAVAANLGKLFEQNVAEEERAGRRSGRASGRGQAQTLRDQRLQTITQFNNERNGFRITEVADDGTCFFKAIIQDNKTGKTFRELRAVLGGIEWGGSPEDIKTLSDFLQRDILTIIQNPDTEDGGYIFDIARRYPATQPIYIFDHAGPEINGQIQRHFDAVMINNPEQAQRTIEEAGAAPVNIPAISPFIPIAPSPNLGMAQSSPRPPSSSPTNYTSAEFASFTTMFLDPVSDLKAVYETIQARSPRFFNKALEMAVAQNVDVALDALERLITYAEEYTQDNEATKRFKKQSEAIRTKFGKNARNLYLLKREGRWRETKRTKLLRRSQKQRRVTRKRR